MHANGQPLSRQDLRFAAIERHSSSSRGLCAALRRLEMIAERMRQAVAEQHRAGLPITAELELELSSCYRSVLKQYGQVFAVQQLGLVSRRLKNLAEMDDGA